MKFFTKKRVVLFLLFIFPLICFLLLSTGKNNFTKLSTITKNVTDVLEIDATKNVTLSGNVSLICFLGEDVGKNKAGLFNLNEKIYKKFIDNKQFQIIALFPDGKEVEAKRLKEEIGAFTDMKNWHFVSASALNINLFYESFSLGEPLVALSSPNAFIIDKKLSLRGRATEEEFVFSYNMNSVSELKDKLKDDINVLYYEYYAAFKERNENKADR
ncbi:hypothetical protein PI23P_03402 [Polaribacter irgensii 23-P]|uniref:Membrane or secreted protein n=1 Tax=Polaribacter irgensii 23-P TaxID=313594 RepID=A4BX17_9FLAO|nr:hypothetical protein [Polaribacter irgensii]EAR13508.1 hypothetical protein PI23P_03402 [Polaribacter irgensii 23-P]